MYPVYIVSKKTTLNFKDLTIKDFKQLIKQDLNTIEFKQTINNIINDNISNIDEITVLDRDVILLYIKEYNFKKFETDINDHIQKNNYTNISKHLNDIELYIPSIKDEQVYFDFITNTNLSINDKFLSELAFFIKCDSSIIDRINTLKHLSIETLTEIVSFIDGYKLFVKSLYNIDNIQQPYSIELFLN
jgi:hypothetical protein